MYWNAAEVSLAPGDKKKSYALAWTLYLLFSCTCHCRMWLPASLSWISSIKWWVKKDLWRVAMQKRLLWMSVATVRLGTYVTRVAELLTWHVHNHCGRFVLHPQDSDWLYRSIAVKSSLFTARTARCKNRYQIIICEAGLASFLKHNFPGFFPGFSRNKYLKFKDSTRHSLRYGSRLIRTLRIFRMRIHRLYRSSQTIINW